MRRGRTKKAITKAKKGFQNAKLAAYNRVEGQVSKLLKGLMKLEVDIRAKGAPTQKMRSTLAQFAKRQQQRQNERSVNKRLASANIDLAKLVNYRKRLKTTLAEIGFLPQLKNATKTTGTALLLLGIYQFTQAENEADKIGAAAIGAGGLLLTGSLNLGKSTRKSDAKTVDDVKIKNPKNINRSTVQRFMSRFEAGRFDDKYKSSAVCSGETCVKLLEDFYHVDDDNFTAICNAWKNKHGRTLRKDIVNTSIVFRYGWDDNIQKTKELKRNITNKMNRLNIP
jgi:hypothetical protein